MLRSPHECKEHTSAIFQHCLKCLSYDPNYADDMEEEDQEEEQDEEDG